MSTEWNSVQICRAEDCEHDGIHRAGECDRRRAPRVHHRPKGKRPALSIESVELDHRESERRKLIEEGRIMPGHVELLSEHVLKAVGNRPTMMGWIQDAVRNDYGQVTDRTIYRHVRRLVQEARLIKLDLGLAFATYVRPRSRWLQDREALRDFMLANADCIPACTKSGAW